MDKCAIIGASEDAVHAIEVAHDKGYYVIALDGDDSAGGLPYADERVVTDIRDSTQVAEILRKHEISFVLPAPIGRWIVTWGAVNESLGLSGIGFSAAEKCVDKYLFHQVLATAGLRSGGCALMKSQEDFRSASRFPCIAKPRYGSGSRLVYRAETRGDLENFARSLRYDEDYVLEDVAEGVEYGLDGAVIDNMLHVVLLREKINTPPPARQCVGYYSVPLDEEELHSVVSEKMREVVATLGLDNCLLHADVMVDDDEVFVIEVSPRPSGHYLHNIFTPLCTGVDVIREYINYLEGSSYSFDPAFVRRMLIRFFDFSNFSVGRVPCEAQIDALDNKPVLYECNIEEGEILSAVSDGHSVMERGYMIFSGGTKMELDAAAQAVMDLFEGGRSNG